MLETLKRHPLVTGIVITVAVVGGVASFIEDIRSLWAEITSDRIPVETPSPQSFSQRDLLLLKADIPVDWIVNRGHIENWLYVIPPGAELEDFDFGEAITGPGNLPYVFERYVDLSLEQYDQLVPPQEQGLTDFEYVSSMAEVFLGEGGWADRYRFRTNEYYIEQVTFIDYYYGGGDANPHLLELSCVVPKAAEDRFRSACSRIIGSSRIE